MKSMPREYQTFNYSHAKPGGRTFLTGIRQVDNSEKVYISGVYTPPGSDLPVGLVFKGKLSGKGKWYVLNYPSSHGVTVTGTSIYGPNNGTKSKTVQLVGNYTTASTGPAAIGFFYEGPLDGLGTWITLRPPSKKPVLNTIAHSTMGGLVVGNYDTRLKSGKAFIYDIETGKYHKIKYPGAVSITAYGIWYNGGDSQSYTICGGYATHKHFTEMKKVSLRTYGHIFNLDRKTWKCSDFTSYSFNNDPTTSLSTHFDGITTDGKGGYNLTGDWVSTGFAESSAFFVHVKKVGENGKWESIHFPGSKKTSGNSVYRDTVIGIYTLGKGRADKICENCETGKINGYVSY